MKNFLAAAKTRTKTAAARSLGWMRDRAILLAAAAAMGAILAPKPVSAQFPSPCCVTLALGMGTVNTTISSVIGGGLNSIGNVEKDIQQLEKTVVWPQAAIAQAQGLIGAIQGIYTQMHSVFSIPISSATLADPRKLESILLSRNAGQIGSMGGSYANVYGSVPLAANAPPALRNTVDMTDAVAQDAMQRAIAIDAIADQELQAADQINNGLQSAAPGSAPILEAQADAWLVRANAYTQSALADLMRVRAIELANSGAAAKYASQGGLSLQNSLSNTLSR